MNRMLLFTILLVCAGLSAIAARAEPYWITYEGNDLPENEGWQRVFGNWQGPGQGGAIRKVENGILTIDSMADDGLVDFARYDMHGHMNPGPGETFIATWRMRVVETRNDCYEPSVGFARDGYGSLWFEYSYNNIRSSYEGWVLPLEPGVYHEYCLHTYDMIHYTLWIDYAYQITGAWDLNSLNKSYVAFGDGTQGPFHGSITEWDYVRYGVVPEPDSLIIYVMCMCLLAMGRRAAIQMYKLRREIRHEKDNYHHNYCIAGI